MNVTHNLRVVDKATAHAEARFVMNTFYKSTYVEFGKAALKGREAFMVLVKKGRHPLAFGPYCDGAAYALWMDQTWGTRAFSLAAKTEDDFRPY